MNCRNCESSELFVLELRGIERKTTEGQIKGYLRIMCHCSDCEKRSVFHFRKDISIEPLRISLVNMIVVAEDDEGVWKDV